jgi:hypothetical protein
MTTLREAAQHTLDFIENHSRYWNGTGVHPQTIVSDLRAALAEDHNEDSLEMVEPVASVTVEQLAKMAESMEGIDSTQPGYQWRKGWNDALRRAMDCAAPPPAKPAQEPVAQCPHCNGSGDIVVMDSAGPDALEVPAPCPHCGGSGSLADAYHGVVKLLEKKSDDYLKCCAELYFRPIAPQPIRKLTDEEILDCIPDDNAPMDLGEAFYKFARAIEDAIWSKT